MSLKSIQNKLRTLRDKVSAEGSFSDQDAKILKELLESALTRTQGELSELQVQLKNVTAIEVGNDNQPLSCEQKQQLSILEKTGTGSGMIH